MIKKILPLVIVAVVAGGLGFWGGSAFTSSKMTVRGTAFQRGTVGFVGGARQDRAGAAFGGALNGTILSKDAQSLTIQNRTSGGSSIVFLAPSTTVSVPTDVSVDTLKVGDTVVVIGKANPDGSIMANSIQIRPLPANTDVPGLPGVAPTSVK